MTAEWTLDDPEVQSVESLVEFLYEEGEATFNAAMLTCVAHNTRTSTHKVRVALESFGLKLANRPKEKTVRGFGSWDNNRWAGNPCGGGSGWEQIAGFAGQKG